MPSRRCITTRYRFLILPWKCGRTATDQPGIKHLVACIDDIVVGHLALDVAQRPRRSHVADFGICVARSGKTAALPAR
jgi:hypothetical protein